MKFWPFRPIRRSNVFPSALRCASSSMLLYSAFMKLTRCTISGSSRSEAAENAVSIRPGASCNPITTLEASDGSADIARICVIEGTGSRPICTMSPTSSRSSSAIRAMSFRSSSGRVVISKAAPAGRHFAVARDHALSLVLRERRSLGRQPEQGDARRSAPHHRVELPLMGVEVERARLAIEAVEHRDDATGHGFASEANSGTSIQRRSRSL